MAFSEGVKDQAYKRSGAQCECSRVHASAPHPGGRCSTKFPRNGAWEAHHVTAVASGGKDTLENCEALCTPCHIRMMMSH